MPRSGHLWAAVALFWALSSCAAQESAAPASTIQTSSAPAAAASASAAPAENPATFEAAIARLEGCAQFADQSADFREQDAPAGYLRLPRRGGDVSYFSSALGLVATFSARACRISFRSARFGSSEPDLRAVLERLGWRADAAESSRHRIVFAATSAAGAAFSLKLERRGPPPETDAALSSLILLLEAL